MDPVSDQQRDRSEAERAELIFRAITAAADNAGMCVCISYVESADPGQVNLLYLNEGTARLIGYSLDEIAQRSVWSFFAPDEVPKLLQMHERRLRGEANPAVLESAVVHKDGRRIPVDISTTRIDLDGRSANVTFLFDVSHRKNAQEALRRSEARFRSLIEHAPDGVMILRWPTIVFANPRAARLLGFRSPDEAVGRNVLELLGPADAMMADERVARLQLGERPPGPTEYNSRDPDGRPLSVEISSIPIEYEGAPAVLGFVRDVTERRAMLMQLMEADKLAAVGTLAAGVAHEINNPLAYLLLNLEFLMRELPKLVDEPSRLSALQTRLDEALEGAERVKTIVRDLQSFTRRDQGIRGPVDLASVVEGVLQMVRHEIRHRASVEKNFEPVPPVHGNATRLEQLFLNLLINAAHAVSDLDPDRGRIAVSIRRGVGERVIASVHDNGTGMEPEVLRQVFDPFFTTKPTGVGTGLGLPICQGIVRALGGDIQLTSTPGAGTTATVTLPLHPTEPFSPRIATPIPPRAISRSGRVLLIDDERAVGESLAIALREEHDVVTLTSAAEARACFAAGEHFDAVLCDLVMPGETGMQLFQYVRDSHPELARRFAFMTGGAFLPEAERFLCQVDNPRIEKPFDVAAVRALVARMLDGA